MEDFQAPWEPSNPQRKTKRTALQHLKFSKINSVFWVFLAFWDPDADSESGSRTVNWSRTLYISKTLLISHKEIGFWTSETHHFQVHVAAITICVWRAGPGPTAHRVMQYKLMFNPMTCACGTNSGTLGWKNYPHPDPNPNQVLRSTTWNRSRSFKVKPSFAIPFLPSLP